MPVLNTHRTVTSDGIEFERWPTRWPSADGQGASTTHIVGVGETGCGLAAALYYYPGLGGITFQHIATTETGAESGNLMQVTSHAPFNGAHLVLILAAVNEQDSLRVSEIVSAGAREAGARVVAMLAQPPFPPGNLVRSVAAGLANHLDAVIYLPESPHHSVLSCLLEAYLVAMRGVEPDSAQLKMPTGADFLDVREAFDGAAGASLGVGHSSGTDRVADAVRLAIRDVGPARLSMAGGLVVMVAGAETLRLQEVAAATYGVWEATSGDVASALAVHYDSRLGDMVRVAVIVAESRN